VRLAVAILVASGVGSATTSARIHAKADPGLGDLLHKRQVGAPLELVAYVIQRVEDLFPVGD
jgi:hypothetical protein